MAARMIFSAFMILLFSFNLRIVSRFQLKDAFFLQMSIQRTLKTVPFGLGIAMIFVLFTGCQTGNKPGSESQRIDTLVDNVRAENEEMQAEQTDGDLYEPVDYNTDPTYSSASE